MVIDNLNEIGGGSVNGRDAWVVYNPWGGSVAEMNGSVASVIDQTSMFSSVYIKGLWDKTQTFEEIEEKIGGKLCEGAKRALLSTNIRGVGVALYFHKDMEEDNAKEAMRLKGHIDNLPQKEWEKVMNILKKYGY